MQLTDVTDPIALARQMIDIPSVSGQEGPLADAVEAALRDAGFGTVPALEILRDGDAVCARTRLGRGQRLVLAGHLDTVPIADNVPGRSEERDGVEILWGRGSVDMLGGCAAVLALACEAGQSARGGARPPLAYDVTWIFYDHEEVASDLNGLGRIHRRHPEWLDGDLALLGEPTCAQVEGGCNGTLRIIARFPGLAAHSARAWMGDNAIHAMAPVIERIAAYGNPVTSVDGLDFRESLSVVRVEQRHPRVRLHDGQLPFRALKKRRGCARVGEEPLRGNGSHRRGRRPVRGGASRSRFRARPALPRGCALSRGAGGR